MDDLTASDEAKKALEGVSPGPWECNGEPWNLIVWNGSWNRVCFMAHSNGLDDDRDVANARFIAWAREGVPALLAEIAAKDAEIARLRGEIIEATDENFIWGAMDNVHDAETTLDDYAAAVSRAQRAAIASVKRWW